MRVSDTQAKILQAAEAGALTRLDEVPGMAAGGRTYAAGVGTVQKPTIDALWGAQPPLLADGARGDRFTRIELTDAGRAALDEHRQGARLHVGKGRRG